MLSDLRTEDSLALLYPKTSSKTNLATSLAGYGLCICCSLIPFFLFLNLLLIVQRDNFLFSLLNYALLCEALHLHVHVSGFSIDDIDVYDTQPSSELDRELSAYIQLTVNRIHSHACVSKNGVMSRQSLLYDYYMD